MAEWFSGGDRSGQVDIGDRGLQYGDGLFETVAVRAGELRLWDLHMLRLVNGCRRLSIRAPAPEFLRETVQQALVASSTSDAAAIAKIVVTAGAGRRGYARGTVEEPSIFTGIFAAKPLPKAHYGTGVSAMVCKTRLASGSPHAGLKTLNRLEQVLARSELTDGVFEGLTLDADGNLICGTMSNVFFVHQNSVTTPSVERCGVAGVMRRKVVEVLAGRGIDVDECEHGVQELTRADEVFLTNSQFGVLSLRSCDGARWTDRSFARQLASWLREAGIREPGA